MNDLFINNPGPFSNYILNSRELRSIKLKKMKENSSRMPGKLASPNIEIVEDSDDEKQITINDNDSDSDATAVPIIDNDSGSEISIKPISKKVNGKMVNGKNNLKKMSRMPTFEPEEFKFFSNNKKTKPFVEKQKEADSDSESEESEQSDSENSDNISISEDDSASQCSSQSSEPEVKVKLTKKQKEQRKQELLIKLIALEKKGVTLTKNYSLKSSLEDIEFEYETQRQAAEMEASVHFQQKILMASVTGIEFLNKKFDPIGAKLEGWSESVMDNITDYEEIFKKLHEKYSERASMPPELQLLVTLVGSGFMFHLTQSLFKSSLPGLGDALKSNPDIMKNIMGAMGQSLNNAQGNIVKPNQEQLQQQQQLQDNLRDKIQQDYNYNSQNSQNSQNSMSGPSVNLSSLMNTYNKGPDLPKVQQSAKIKAPPIEDDRISIASSSSNISEIKTVPLVQPKGKGKGRGKSISIS